MKHSRMGGRGGFIPPTLPPPRPTVADAHAEVMRGHRGDMPEASCTHCVMDDSNAGGRGCGNNSTMPVGSKPLGDSVSGVSDLSGNVWEWTQTGDVFRRVLRGGSWGNVRQSYLRAYGRMRGLPGDGGSAYGFRCAAVSSP